mgnify:CR=1 FL=1
MKKILSGVLAACMAVGVCAFATGCNETIENGSKIEKCTITFDVDGKEEAITFKLYMNIAPDTIDHFKYLAGKGYYDGTVVSDVQHGIEFGAYSDAAFENSLDEKYGSIINSTYAATKKIVYTSKFTIVGEMSDNGVVYKGENLSLEKVKEIINARDEEDRHRVLSPLIMTSDSVLIDTSDMTILGVVDEMIQKINQKKK